MLFDKSEFITETLFIFDKWNANDFKLNALSDASLLIEDAYNNFDAYNIWMKQYYKR